MEIVKGIKGSPELNLVMEKIGSDYEVLEYLGGGGFSHVYLIRHKLLGKKRALKIMDFSGILNDLKKANVPDIHQELKRIKKRFINEAKHYDNIDHTNIAKIYDVGIVTSKHDDIEVPYLIMQYLDGKSLKEFINEAKDSFKLERIIRISKDILLALDALHLRKIIHRDIKPENIIIEKGSDKAILIDFGLAKDMIYGTKLTIALAAMGTPEYMSPEQFKDSGHVGPETDIYAFGVLLYHMVTGTLPYHGNFYELMKKHCEAPFPDIVDKNPAISSELNAIIKKTMAKKAEERYRTPKELLHALESLENKDKSIIRQKSSKYVPYKKVPTRNKKRWIVLLILAIIMIFAAFLYKDQLKKILGLPGFIENTDGKEATKSKLTEEDDRAFESASSENTIEAFEGYMKNYPSGRHTDEANTKLKKLMENLSIVIQSDYNRPIFDVKFSPDGKNVFSVDGRQNIQIWNSSNFKMIKSSSSRHRRLILSSSFSPDGKYIVTAGFHEETFNLYELKTLSKIRTFNGHSDYVYSVDFSPVGKFVISGSLDKTIKLWDVELGDDINTFKCPAAITSVKFTPDGKHILSSDSENALILWDIKSGKKVRSFRGHSGYIWELDISPNGKYALSGGIDNKIKLWDISSGKEIGSFKGHFSIYTDCLKFSPDGKYFLSCISDHNLKMWETGTGKEIRTFSGHSDDEVFSTDFSPDGNYIISGSMDGTIILWDIGNGKIIKTIQRSFEHLDEVTFSSSGKFVLTKTEKDIILWDVEAGKVIMTIKGNTDDGNSIAFTSDERYFLSSNEGKEIILWEVQTGKKIQTFLGHTKSVNSIDISPDSKYFLSCSRDHSIKLWSLESGKEIRTYSGHSDEVISVAFSSDGKFALSGSEDKTMKLWNIEKGREIRNFKEDTGVVKVFFSPDPKYVIMSGNLGKISFWDIETGRKVRTLELHRLRTISIAFSTDGKRAISGGDDDKVKLWDVQTGKIMRIFEKHQSTVCEVAFINEEEHIISGSVDGSVILWEIESGKELARFISFRDDEWAAVTSEGYYNCSPNGEKYLNVVSGMKVYSMEKFRSKFFKPEIFKTFFMQL